MKIIKGKSSSVKAKHTVKVVNQSWTKQVRRLKGKNSKVIYFYNNQLRDTQHKKMQNTYVKNSHQEEESLKFRHVKMHLKLRDQHLKTIIRR